MIAAFAAAARYAAAVTPPPLLSCHFTPFRLRLFFAIIDAPLRHYAIFRCFRLIFSFLSCHAFSIVYFAIIAFAMPLPLFRVFAFACCH
jgi:hypothetical protein